MDPNDPASFPRWNAPATTTPETTDNSPPPIRSSSTFEDEYREFDPAKDPARLVDRLLRRPGQLAFELAERSASGLSLKLAMMVVVTFAAYGLLVGSFSGQSQYWAAPLKICIGILVSALICLPSLYIFSCLSGGSLALSRIGGLLLEALALCGVLLCGFLPVVWLFGQSTHSISFMSALHWVFWLICLAAGLRLLGRALCPRTAEGSRYFKVWSVIFALVVFQMATFVRPLVGPAGNGVHLQAEKMGFLQHWGAAR